MNGRALYTSVNFGSTVRYECRHQFTLVGNTTRVCGARKEWEDEMPVCKGELYKTESYLRFFFFLILFVNLLIFQKLTAVLPVFFLMDIMNWKERFKDQLFTLDVMME